MLRPCLALLLAAAPLAAQNAPAVPAAAAPAAPLKVAVVERPPFAIAQKDAWTGFSIELWQEIATLNKWTCDYARYPNMEAALNAVAAGECGVLVSDTSITAARLKTVDFSQPFFRGGLQIMITNARPKTWAYAKESLLGLFHLEVLWIVIAVIVALTLFVEWFERKHNPSFPKARLEGFAEAFYLTVSLALTGKSQYKGFPGTPGRLAMVAWMLMGVLMVAYLTSSITSTMTYERLRSHINGPDDLPGKAIGVLGNSTSEEYAAERHLDYTSYPDMDAAVAALVAGEIQAIVGDAPELQYYDNSHPKVPITEVGPVFHAENYGFALPKGDPRRYAVDETLVGLNERGFTARLGNQYFGSVYRP